MHVFVEGAALDPEKMFHRFHKDSNDKNNTGLGLAIVKAIVGFYGFEIHYSFDNEHVIEVILFS